MDADLGVMTIVCQSRRTVSPRTRWSRSSLCKDFGSNREPLATASSDESAILSRLANTAIRQRRKLM
jgi:hypothetical protein